VGFGLYDGEAGAYYQGHRESPKSCTTLAYRPRTRIFGLKIGNRGEIKRQTSAGSLWFSAVSSALSALIRAGLGTMRRRLQIFSKSKINWIYAERQISCAKWV